MSVSTLPAATLHPRHARANARTFAERSRLVSRMKPSARDLFPALRERLLASRPVLSIVDEGRPTQRVVFGAPTFRNVIENGTHQ